GGRQAPVGITLCSHCRINHFVITLKPGKPGFFILICNNPKKCEAPRRFHISQLPLIFILMKI
ncbi:hypothetical protein, partial [Escherichia coli]|uniref:hypothetical protein n=1 Tax=Escherichia coli TaxID=562 RepID=UPI0019552819